MRRIILIFTIVTFLTGGFSVSELPAQKVHLPAPGTIVHLSSNFQPPLLRGIKIHPKDPLKFDFVLDQGQDASGLQNESLKLLKYFLAALTVPDNDLWVNLSPYEKDRIVSENFGQTEMGRDLLAQDYLLKQITASLIYPEDAIGREFWKRVYAQASAKFGTDVSVNTFNKVWIVPEKADIYENAKTGAVYIVAASLKVMLEEDYMASKKNPLLSGASSGVKANDIIREVIIPQLTREVNYGKSFLQLRQVYHSLILAAWYKKKLKNSIFSKAYRGQNKVAGIQIEDLKEKEVIYEHYLQAFKKGVYNYVKDEKDPVTLKRTPRKYFSGGAELRVVPLTSVDAAQVVPLKNPAMQMEVNIRPADAAMAKIDDETVRFDQHKHDLANVAGGIAGHIGVLQSTLRLIEANRRDGKNSGRSLGTLEDIDNDGIEDLRDQLSDSGNQFREISKQLTEPMPVNQTAYYSKMRDQYEIFYGTINKAIENYKELTHIRRHNYFKVMLDEMRSYLSFLSQGKYDLTVAEKQPADLNTAIRLTRFMYVKYEFNLAPDVGVLSVDLFKFKQAMRNLYKNAANAGASKIIVDTKRKDDQIFITISDNGPGIAPEILPKVFDLYFTTKPKGEGTGLGLYNVKQIIEAHGGRISVQSTLGEGTTFEIILPAVDRAMREEGFKGGIDFNTDELNLNVKNGGRSYEYQADPAVIEQIQKAPGFVPVIIRIKPLKDIRLFLGLSSTVL
jgi:signal transduction histidine kinase